MKVCVRQKLDHSVVVEYEAEADQLVHAAVRHLTAMGVRATGLFCFSDLFIDAGDQRLELPSAVEVVCK